MRVGAEQVLADARSAVRDAGAVGSAAESRRRSSIASPRRRRRRHGDVAAAASPSISTLPLIQADHDRGDAAGVGSTPTFFVDGKHARRRRRPTLGAGDRRRARDRSRARSRAPDARALPRPTRLPRARRSWRAARRSSRRTANRSFCATLRARRGIRARYRAWGADRARSQPAAALDARAVGRRRAAGAAGARAGARSDGPTCSSRTRTSRRAPRRSRAASTSTFATICRSTRRATRASRSTRSRPTALVFSKLDVWPIDHARGARARRPTRDDQRDARARIVAPVAHRRRAAARRVRVARGRRRDRRRRRRPPRRSSACVRTSSPSPATRATIRSGCARSASIARARCSSACATTRPTIVAGSTWPADEAVLLAGVRGAAPGGVDARLIIAPHEPTPDHVAPHRRVGEAREADASRASTTPTQSTADVVVVDRVGVLGELYALADIAFVGGGFHAAGLHSVLEPAAFGAPVLFGPRIENSRDAALLAQRGGGVVGDDRGASSRAVCASGRPIRARDAKPATTRARWCAAASAPPSARSSW